MHNDKLFVAYSTVLVAAVTSVIWASVSAGITTLPTTLLFGEHVALSLGFRAAYKSVGGWEWMIPWWVDRTPVTANETAEISLPGIAADAVI